LPETLIERGIGETRLILVEGGDIVEARILLDGVAPAGAILRAQLHRAASPAIARAEGQEFLLPKGAPGLTEGMPVTIAVTREAIPGGEPWKRPLAKVAEGEAPAPAPPGKHLPFPSPHDQLADAGWLDLLDEARSGTVRFAGGELRVSLTPAMTLIDVDGHLAPPDLAVAAAGAAARTIRRHGVGGSIGIDFPTVAGKAQRQAISAAIDSELPLPFERTAVNGFGFLQIVRPRRHASLFELAADGAAFEARALLRQAALGRAGPKQIAAHPAVIGVLESRPAWIAQLQQQLGGSIGLRADPTRPMSGGHVQG
jgi:hypothetical protein